MLLQNMFSKQLCFIVPLVLLSFCGLATLYTLLKFLVITLKQISKITFVVTGYSEAVKKKSGKVCSNQIDVTV